MLELPQLAPNLRSLFPNVFRLEECDPFADDTFDDVPIVTSERRLRRLAIVAADVGGRFARDQIVHDPAAWMMTPLKFLDGERPIDACQERRGFVRASLLIHLALGMDASPGALDALAGDDELAEEFDSGAISGEDEDSPRLLFSATLQGPVGCGSTWLQAFCAMLAPDEDTVRRRLAARYGGRLAEEADVRCGFSAQAPLATDLLSASRIRELLEVAQGGAMDSGVVLDVHGERRYVP